MEGGLLVGPDSDGRIGGDGNIFIIRKILVNGKICDFDVTIGKFFKSTPVADEMFQGKGLLFCDSG